MCLLFLSLLGQRYIISTSHYLQECFQEAAPKFYLLVGKLCSSAKTRCLISIIVVGLSITSTGHTKSSLLLLLASLWLVEGSLTAELEDKRLLASLVSSCRWNSWKYLCLRAWFAEIRSFGSKATRLFRSSLAEKHQLIKNVSYSIK